jgi:hypothetical protein
MAHVTCAARIPEASIVVGIFGLSYEPREVRELAFGLRTQIPFAGTIKLAPGIDVALVAKLFHEA